MKKLIKNAGNNWLPDYTAKSVLEVDFNYLRRQGIKAVLFDLDHTLLFYKEIIIDVRLVQHIKESGLKVYIATNRRHSTDLDEIALQINASGIMHAKSREVYKPSREYYRHAVELTGLKPKEVLMVGDRLVQDAWGAKHSGLKSLLVGKFGPVHGLDHIVSFHDRMLPKVFAHYYKDV